MDDRQVAPGRIQLGRILEHCGTLYSKNGQVNPSNIVESLDPSNARTEWIEPPKQTIPTSPVADNTEFTTLDLAERTQVLEKDITIPIKIKLKTRGPATESPVTVDDVGNDDPSPIAPSAIPVSKRAYKTFSALFYNPARDVLPGEIPWTEFLHALSSAGFSVEKQNGSAWLFVPPALMGRRPIIFHEPHPSSKILIHVARRHGRRLARAYGWTRETFVMA